MMNIKRKALILIITAFCLGCNNKPTCIPEYSNLLEISFVDKTGKAKNIFLASVEAQGSSENFPVIKDSTISTLSIPLNPLDTLLLLLIDSDTAVNTLLFNYKTLARLIAPECGLESIFNQLEIDATDFKNAVVINDLLHEKIPINVKITH